MTSQHTPLHTATRLLALLLATPAFYLLLAPPSPRLELLGASLYGLQALLWTGLLYPGYWPQGQHRWWQQHGLNWLLWLGACSMVALLWLPLPDSLLWLARVLYSLLVFVALLQCVRQLLAQRGISLILLLAVAGMLLAGLGFYWLEPTATSYLDGLWLAFVTGSTVGYGDIVPTSHAARLLAVFTVLSGFTFLSVVTAYFAALLIGEDEKKLQRELHHNMRTLHAEIAALRQEIQRLPTAAAAPLSSTIKADQPKTD